ncbi:MAG: hypothetical protein U9R79_06755 [Armatimonadota bacterium]|nr:hypothetical protein [Armatimonadota bacterium]
MIELKSRLELFVDDFLIERMEGLSLRLHSPQRQGTVITLDRGWEGSLCGYPAIVPHGGGWRMYYRGWPDEHGPACVCLAESEDGIQWRRPSLGLIEFDGSAENNILLSDETMAGERGGHNFAPVRDTCPGVPDEERYKALAYGPDVGDRLHSLQAYASGDGIHWRQLNNGEPVFRARDPKVMLDSQNVGFWDEVAGEYRLYGRIWVGPVRHIFLSRSDDFIHWSDPEPLDMGDAPLEHLYTNATVPYDRAPHILLAFPKRFVPHRKRVEEWPHQGLSEAVFMTSRDGLHWHRHLEAFVRPGLGSRCWTERNFMVARGMIPSAPGELSVYWMEDYRRPAPRIVRGTVRTDGFVSVNAPYAGGELVTKPFTFEGERLLLNCSTSAAGGIHVELQDKQGRPLPGMSLQDCPEIYGDEIDMGVPWPAAPAVRKWAGTPVRLRFAMRDADLFALRFAPATR